MTDVQTTSVPDLGQPVPDKATLLVRLDASLEQYLNILDQYEQAQRQLASLLASGYMSLAQANFNNTSRTRYGQDYFDDRMQATRKIDVKERDSRFVFAIAGKEINTTTQSFPGSEGITPSSPERKKDAPAEAMHVSEEAPEGADSKDAATSNETSEANDSSTNSNKSSTDPLRWFGILVPPALRSAQSSFASTVEGPVTQLASLVRELRRLEIDVARLRKQIRKL